jgi:putative FmdB family regulatory protein
MFYDFECDDCKTRVEKQYRMGNAPRSVKCANCGGRAKRAYNSFALAMDGGINRGTGFGESLKRRNEKAGKRMRERTPPVRTVAHDHGNGDIRAV